MTVDLNGSLGEPPSGVDHAEPNMHRQHELGPHSQFSTLNVLVCSSKRAK